MVTHRVHTGFDPGLPPVDHLAESVLLRGQDDEPLSSGRHHRQPATVRAGAVVSLVQHSGHIAPVADPRSLPDPPAGRAVELVPPQWRGAAATHADRVCAVCGVANGAAGGWPPTPGPARATAAAFVQLRFDDLGPAAVDLAVHVSHPQAPEVAEKPVQPAGTVGWNLSGEKLGEAATRTVAEIDTQAADTEEIKPIIEAPEACDVPKNAEPGQSEALGSEQHPWMVLEWAPTTRLRLPTATARPRHRAVRAPWTARLRLWWRERRHRPQTTRSRSRGSSVVRSAPIMWSLDR
jgi:hypothetical protein